MSIADKTDHAPTVSRRSLLYATTAAVGAAGVVAAVWPFVDQLNPDAATRASGGLTEAYIGGLQPGEPRMLRWRDLPIVVVRRTSPMIAALRDEKLLARMADPRSEKRQQPSYAAN
jgi:ubiquinol-cytochrome c reductase iron-sulfur subunit